MTTSISEMARKDEERTELFKLAEKAAQARFNGDNRRGDYMEGFMAGWRANDAAQLSALQARLDRVIKGCE